jgi:hypothetical protein
MRSQRAVEARSDLKAVVLVGLAPVPDLPAEASPERAPGNTAQAERSRKGARVTVREIKADEHPLAGIDGATKNAAEDRFSAPPRRWVRGCASAVSVDTQIQTESLPIRGLLLALQSTMT